MPRPRKIDAEQLGHLTAEQRAKKERETELAYGDATLIRQAPKAMLQDDVAVKKWRYIVKVKRAEKTLSNADYDNLIVYCNAWSNYVRAMEIQKKNSGNPDLLMAGMRMEKQATDTLYKYGARLGLDLNSRLKQAAVKVEKEQTAVETQFGGI